MTTIAIAIVRTAIILGGEPSKKKQRTDTNNDAKRIKSDDFTRSNKEKSNIGIAILENKQLDDTIIISYFGGSNNIFADCTHGCADSLKNVKIKTKNCFHTFQIRFWKFLSGIMFLYY